MNQVDMNGEVGRMVKINIVEVEAAYKSTLSTLNTKIEIRKHRKMVLITELAEKMKNIEEMKEETRKLEERIEKAYKLCAQVDEKIEILKKTRAIIQLREEDLQRNISKAHEELLEKRRKFNYDLETHRRKLDEILANYRKHPLYPLWEKAVKELDELRTYRKALESELSQCNANLLKIKCDKTRRMREENVYYPLDNFIVIIAQLKSIDKKNTEKSKEVAGEILTLKSVLKAKKNYQKILRNKISISRKMKERNAMKRDGLSEEFVDTNTGKCNPKALFSVSSECSSVAVSTTVETSKQIPSSPRKHFPGVAIRIPSVKLTEHSFPHRRLSLPTQKVFYSKRANVPTSLHMPTIPFPKLSSVPSASRSAFFEKGNVSDALVSRPDFVSMSTVAKTAPVNVSERSTNQIKVLRSPLNSVTEIRSKILTQGNFRQVEKPKLLEKTNSVQYAGQKTVARVAPETAHPIIAADFKISNHSTRHCQPTSDCRSKQLQDAIEDSHSSEESSVEVSTNKRLYQMNLVTVSNSIMSHKGTISKADDVPTSKTVEIPTEIEINQPNVSANEIKCIESEDRATTDGNEPLKNRSKDKKDQNDIKRPAKNSIVRKQLFTSFLENSVFTVHEMLDESDDSDECSLMSLVESLNLSSGKLERSCSPTDFEKHARMLQEMEHSPIYQYHSRRMFEPLHSTPKKR